MKIAILEDDKEHLAAATLALEASGHEVAGYERTAGLLAALRGRTFDLLILDWQLPDRPGIEVVRWVRANLNPALPMLLLTSRTEDADIVAGLDAGADDYLTKPVSSSVLNARVNALARRVYGDSQPGGPEVHGDYSFQPGALTVAFDGREATLTAKEFALALILFRNLLRPLSRNYLLEAVWGGDPGVQSRSLDMHISRVRTKLGLRPERGYRLAPVYSYGYRLETIGSAPGSGV